MEYRMLGNDDILQEDDEIKGEHYTNWEKVKNTSYEFGKKIREFSFHHFRRPIKEAKTCDNCKISLICVVKNSECPDINYKHWKPKENKMKNIISLKELIELGACKDGIEWFAQTIEDEYDTKVGVSIVVAVLKKENRPDWIKWLKDKGFEEPSTKKTIVLYQWLLKSCNEYVLSNFTSASINIIKSSTQIIIRRIEETRMEVEVEE